MATATELHHDVAVDFVRRKGWTAYCRTCRWSGINFGNQQRHAWDDARTHQRNEDEKLIRRAQAAYVAQWREQHPQQVLTTIWECPLCGKAVQCFVAGLDPHDEPGAASFLARRHQHGHGQDWLDYEAQAPGGAGGE